MKLLLWVPGAAICLAMAGCGAVGDPLPPLLDIPKPPLGLAAKQQGGRILVTWPAPTLTTEGVAPRMDRVGPVKVFRVMIGELKATATEADFKNAVEVASLPPAKTDFSEAVDPAWFNHTVVYSVKYSNQRNETAGFSNLAAAPVLAVGAAPEVHSELTEKEIRLTWTAARGASYKIYRDGALVGDATNGTFADTHFEFDHNYTYVVRTAVKRGTIEVESEDSKPAVVNALDTFPPAPPEGLRALLVGDQLSGGVDLSWSPSPEADLAGYNVYRGTTKLNEKPLRNTLYRDLTPGTAPRYRVTAVDTHGNESKPSTEVAP